MYFKRTILVLCLFISILSFGNAANPLAGKQKDIPIGVVEGFYKEPWSHQDRLSIIKFMGESGMNYYVYAPKDDPYHRDKWREAYPPAQMAQIKELVNQSKKYHVRFCFAISPGLSIKYSSPDDFDVLYNKLKTMYDLGIRDFALFLDDVSSNLQYPEDKAAFPSYGDAHVKLTNDLYAALKKLDKNNHLIFCPTEYYKITTSPYLETIGKGINRDVPIIWTGDGVTTPTMYTDHLMRIRAIFRRKPFVWDNYPVNDYYRTRLMMGPILGRSIAFKEHISGYIANPMNESELSKIPLYTIAEYFKDPIGYAPEKSFNKAVMAIGGKKGYPYLREFCEEERSSFLTTEESVFTGLDIANFLENPSCPLAKKKLTDRLQMFVDIKKHFNETISDKKLIKEAEPYLEKLSNQGKAGMAAVIILEKESITADDPQWIEFKNQLQALRQNQYYIGDKAFRKLIQAAQYKAYHDMGKEGPMVITTMPCFESNIPEQAVDGDTTTYFWSYRNPVYDDYFMVDYGKMTTANSVLLLTGKPDRPDDFYQNGICEFSEDGLNWFGGVAMTKLDNEVLVKKPFRYLRVRTQAEQEKWVVIREIVLQ